VACVIDKGEGVDVEEEDGAEEPVVEEEDDGAGKIQCSLHWQFFLGLIHVSEIAHFRTGQAFGQSIEKLIV
jgi:hypothetical protein